MVPYNIRWMGDILAVGPCPQSASHWDMLADRGFASAVVLRDGRTPLIVNRLAVRELRHDDTPSTIDDGITDALCAEPPTYVCSERGTVAAARLVDRFVAAHDLRVVEGIYWDAKNLSSGDQFDWVSGHADFGDERGVSRIRSLVGALANPDTTTRLNAADTLAELMDHADHGCFGTETLRILERVQPVVAGVVSKLNPRFASEYQRIFRKLARETVLPPGLRESLRILGES